MNQSHLTGKFSEDQYELLKRCSENKKVTEWNEWRNANPNIKILLGYANLQEADLIGINLSGADLAGAKLSEANLIGADLTLANLTHARLRGANLRGADLSGADLSNANLSEVNLSGAILRKTILNETVLYYANLSESNLIGADLNKADISKADLCYANLMGANFTQANLSEANLNGAILKNACLKLSNIHKSNLTDALLTGANMYGIDTTRCINERVTCDYIYTDAEGIERIPANRAFNKGEFEEYISGEKPFDKVEKIKSKTIREMNHVFISYVHENYQLVRRLIDTLEVNNIKVWFDKERLRPAVPWEQAIKDAINDGIYFLACFSDNYTRQDVLYMNKELEIALKQMELMPDDNEWFIPVKLTYSEIQDMGAGLNKALTTIKWIDLSRNWEEGVQIIINLIKGD